VDRIGDQPSGQIASREVEHNPAMRGKSPTQAQHGIAADDLQASPVQAA
jgi:hypothetical protein